jgi:hypothetical protein
MVAHLELSTPNAVANSEEPHAAQSGIRPAPVNSL